MRIYPKIVRRFQEGGAMPAEDPAMAEAPMEDPGMQGAPEQGGDPLMQLAQMAMQALQGQDCQAAMAVCEGFVQLIQQAQGGGAPQEAAPEGEPVFRRGGKIVGRMRRR